MGLRVRIIDKNHAHYPETGELTGQVITLTFGTPPNNQMAYMKLDACRHGVDACYVSKGQVTRL